MLPPVISWRGCHWSMSSCNSENRFTMASSDAFFICEADIGLPITFASSLVLLQPVKGAGGLSAAPTEAEGRYALAWARNIWSDTLM